jgi:hypothetical protein
MGQINRWISQPHNPQSIAIYVHCSQNNVYTWCLTTRMQMIHSKVVPHFTDMAVSPTRQCHQHDSATGTSSIFSSSGLLCEHVGVGDLTDQSGVLCPLWQISVMEDTPLVMNLNVIEILEVMLCDKHVCDHIKQFV